MSWSIMQLGTDYFYFYQTTQLYITTMYRSVLSMSLCFLFPSKFPSFLLFVCKVANLSVNFYGLSNYSEKRCKVICTSLSLQRLSRTNYKVKPESENEYSTVHGTINKSMAFTYIDDYVRVAMQLYSYQFVLQLLLVAYKGDCMHLCIVVPAYFLNSYILYMQF